MNPPSPLKNLPNFFLLGAAKAGTTSLYHCLKQHPKVFMPANKEPRFFDLDEFYQEGLTVYLERHFKGSDGYPARGEATPAFHRPEKVIPRMKTACGRLSPKFLIILRDPVERAWSHYLHRVFIAREEASFEHALELEESRLQADRFGWFGYFSDGLYGRLLAKWLEHFPQEHFLFLLSHEFEFRPREIMVSVSEFLGLDGCPPTELMVRKNIAARPWAKWLMRFQNQPPSLVKGPLRRALSPYTRRRINIFLKKINRRPYPHKPKMNEQTETRLRAMYREDILKLEKLIHRNLCAWL